MKFNREKVPLYFWRTALVLVIVIAVLLVIGTPVYFLIIKPHYEERLDEYQSFATEYSGYALVNPLEDHGALAVISFDGEKNGKGEFSGNVTVTVNGETVCECSDLEFQGEDGSFLLVTDDGWTPNLGVPRDTRIVGSIRVDGDMESFLLIPSGFDGQYVAFVAPAQTHSEAYDLYFELYGTEKP